MSVSGEALNWPGFSIGIVITSYSIHYTKLYEKGGETDFKEPLIAREGDTVEDVCNKLHRNMKKQFRYGMVWGKSVKFGGQRVGLDHILFDEDVLTIIKKRGT